jgi:hypothetical protein
MRDELTIPDEFERHPVVIALGKARAMEWIVGELGQSEPNKLQGALDDAPDGTREWLHAVAREALQSALSDAEAVFRKTLSAEEAFAQSLSLVNGRRS